MFNNAAYLYRWSRALCQVPATTWGPIFIIFIPTNSQTCLKFLTTAIS